MLNGRVKNYEWCLQYLEQKLSTVEKKAGNSCEELFISEYVDGSNQNKVLEIYNPSDSVKNLNDYSIKIFQNGAPTPVDIPLSGNLAPKETYVITNPLADANILAKADQTDVNMYFDGNDAIVLNRGQSTYVDKIGEIGVNPGQGGWDVPPSASTKEYDLRRKYPVDGGEMDWTQGKMQWDAFDKDSTQNVRQHDNVCTAAPPVETLNLYFANEQETGISTKYFEFDIMIEGSSNSTYLDNAIVNLRYNINAFGNNVVANPLTNLSS